MRSEPIHTVRFLYDLKTTMRDGVRLSTDVYLPTERGQYPAILLRTPYESTRDQHVDWAIWWAQRGYAAVIQDCRGKFESEGRFYAYSDDGPDGRDTLAWLANQPWCNGKIGMSGRSYGGIVQWQAATHGGSPYLTALAPQVIMGDYFGECHRIGGAVQWALTMLATVTFETAVALTQRGCAQIFGNQRFYRHLPLITADEALIGRPIPFYRDWLEHNLDDAYWRALNTHDRVDQVTVPVCQQAAWFDPYTDAMFKLWNGMRERGGSDLARRNQKIYVLPWTHHIPEGSRLGDLEFGPGAFVDLNLEDLRWFDYWLKGIDNGIMAEPPIKIFVMGRNEWRYEYEWPLARTVFTPYYLHSNGRANTLYGDGTLSAEPPGAEPPDRYSYDPNDPVPTLGGNHSLWTLIKFAAEPVYPGPVDQRSIERRDDVLCYTSAPLEQDLEVTGPLTLVLYAASSARDTDFTAKLVDVYPNGYAIHLSEGILRARNRHGLDREELLEPGEAQEYRISMAATSNCFRRGHRIRLEISSSNFPRFDRNLNSGEPIATGTQIVTAHQTVLHAGAYPSHILLPVIPSA
jgi:putative CocE/NonD family hydrolase